MSTANIMGHQGETACCRFPSKGKDTEPNFLRSFTASQSLVRGRSSWENEINIKDGGFKLSWPSKNVKVV